jgi:hypothetical protein
MVAFDCECGQHLVAPTPDELAVVVRDHLVAAHPDMPAEEDDLEALLDEYAYHAAAAVTEE